ncbi:uncharacterized protein [Oscarella lobularis]|uniref:uncharacterized protein isoform X3 n=1 Tax=Oscarella lobularis TaxID=121494 RepID=UPI0033131EBD
MAWLRQILRKNDSSDGDSQTIAPEKRVSHECALVDDHLHLFGGFDGSNFVPRNEIFVTNVRRAEKKWIRRLTRGRTIPPPCDGARCVVIQKMIYSYGGRTDKRRFLGIVYCLDPKKMKWIEVATPIGGKKPHERSLCCLCSIGSRMIMFGGGSEKKIPLDQLQSGATQDKCGWSNDIYEFRLEEGNEKGMWLDLELGGTRPKPLVAAAMATIDEHRALLHGRDVEEESHSILIDLNRKLWTIIEFNVKPSPRHRHAICQLVTEDESICLLVGGRMVDETNSDYVYVLDCDNSKAYQMDVDQQLGKVTWHTCHCVQNEDKTIDVIVCGGVNWDWTFRPILSCFCLDVKNEPYMKIKREILSSRRASVRAATSSPRLSLPSDREGVEMMQRELEHLRRRCSELTEEKSSIRNELASAERQIAQMREELTSSHRLVERKEGQLAQIRRDLASVQREASFAQRRLEQEKDQQIASIRGELATSQRLAQGKDGVIARIRGELDVSVTHCRTLEASCNEMRRTLDDFTDVLNINGDDVHVTDQKLGSGGFASVSVGQWRGVTVAVKKIHDLITNRRNMAMFKQEVLVCSRLHHPNIMTVCGAVMTERVPFQMIMELLEGSVGEVITAAHASESYLTIYEQLSIAMDMTSGIAYLLQNRPRPYIHGDIRPSNVLVTKDMKVKVGDLGAAHLIESSLSAGPLSPPYLAPERAPRADGTAASSTLSSDVYSVGVSLIEIFTGEGPVPEVRNTQLASLANRPNLLMLCSRLIDCNPANRPLAQSCFETLLAEFVENKSRLVALGGIASNRMVKGVFEGDTHKVVFPGLFY